MKQPSWVKQLHECKEMTEGTIVRLCVVADLSSWEVVEGAEFGGRESVIDIKFCPFCGTKLEAVTKDLTFFG